jgi:predicted ATPase
LAAGLSQDFLADRAQMSAAAVSALERGTRRAPYRATVALLAEALGLSAEQRAALESAAENARARSVRRELTAGQPANNLPTQLTSFIGREDELAELSALMTDHRLVTVTGSGGVGKTRAALEVAARSLPASGDEVWFVDLASLFDGALIASKIASVLQVAFDEQADPVLALARRLKGRRSLLILDNCEHLVADAAAAAKTILQNCPHIKILATSRERLGIAGELVYRLPSLPIPDVSLNDAQQARSYAALELFVDRATFSEPRFVPTEQRIRVIADICRRLEGMPLAIELAAAHLPTLGLNGLRARLRERVVLPGGARDLPQRQRTMLATIAWSYDLLTEPERVLLRRIAIFAGGFTLEAAQAVCAGELLEAAAIPDILSSLVDKSLVNVVLAGEVARYVLLETVRSFGLERLDDAGEAALLARRHGQWFAAFADRAEAAYRKMARTRLTELLPELDNVRAALDWALKSQSEDDAVLGGWIAGGLRAIWIIPGWHDECRHWVEAALERIDETRYPLVAARLLRALVQVTHGDAMEAAAARATPLFERVGDRLGLALQDTFVAMNSVRRGKLEEAERLLARAETIFVDEKVQDSVLYVNFLSCRAWLRIRQGKFVEARADAEQSEALCKVTGEEIASLASSEVLAEVEHAAGDVKRAARVLEEALARQSVSPASALDIAAQSSLACYRLLLGDLDGAESTGKEALGRSRGRQLYTSYWTIQLLAAVATLRGRPRVAARLMGFVDAWIASGGWRRSLLAQRTYDILNASLREQLSSEQIAMLKADGSTLTLEEATDEAQAI